MPGAGTALAVFAVTLRHARRLGFDCVTDGATETAAGGETFIDHSDPPGENLVE